MRSHIIQGVPFISQLLVYPTGCESVSCTMALQYLGWKGTVNEFIDRYLPKGTPPYQAEDGSWVGDDPWKVFPGDPYSPDGWGCFPPVLEEAVSHLPEYTCTVFYNRPLEELKDLIDQDIPVIFWATIGFAVPHDSLAWTTPDGRRIQWVSPMHCTLLIGYDENGYYFNDPTSGQDAYFSNAAVETAYQAQGSLAMIVQRR